MTKMGNTQGDLTITEINEIKHSIIGILHCLVLKWRAYT